MDSIPLKYKKLIWLFVMFVFPLALVSRAGAVEERYPVGHPDQGLPYPDFLLTPYHKDPNHVLNRIFHDLVVSTENDLDLRFVPSNGRR